MRKFTFEVTRQYEFKGTVEVEAETYEEAQRKAADKINDTVLSMGEMVEGSDTVDGIDASGL